MFTHSKLKLTAVSVAAVMAVGGLSTSAQAMPFATIGADRIVSDSPIVEVGYKKRRHVARHRARNNAALGAAIAIGVLGVAAAAAASQPRRGVYVVDNRYYPVDDWGRTIYRARPVQQYEPGYYYHPEPQPYGYREPAWGGHRQAPYGYRYNPGPAYVDRGYGRGWDRPTWNQQVKAQYRAQREAQKQQWRAQQRYGGYGQSVGAGVGTRLAPPTSFFGNENGGGGSN